VFLPLQSLPQVSEKANSDALDNRIRSPSFARHQTLGDLAL
jgi:hypothetical protein